MISKPFTSACLFFLGAGLLLFVLNWFLITGVKQSEHAQTGKVSLLMNHTIDPQVIIFGASNGETGIVSAILEKELNKTVFNMSLDGTSVRQFGDLVREFNGYSRHAEIIVFALGPFAFGKENLPASMNRYYAWTWTGNPYIRKNSFLNEVPEFRKMKYVPFYGFTLYDSYFYKNSFDGWSRLLKHPVMSSSVDHKGWVPMKMQWGENNSVVTLAGQWQLQIDSTVVNEYKNLMEEINRKGRKVVFVMMPCQEEAMNKFIGYEQLRKSVKGIAVEPNRYLDFSKDPITADKKYFYNYTHLNVTGANCFSQLLAKKVK